MVKARAIVDQLGNGPLGPWHVEVWGEEPHDFRRAYTIDAKSDNVAAKEGIDRFVSEMLALDSQTDN